MHSWQDVVLSVGSLIFAVALVPSILSKDKPSFITSALNGVVLAVFGFTYISLSLWYAASTLFLTATLWIVLAIPKLAQK